MYQPPHISIAGAGYWGINLVRNVRALGALTTVCDPSEAALAKIRKQFPGVKLASDAVAHLKDPEFQGIMISSPAVTHYDLARAALLADKDVFVEKPLALKYSEAEELVALARERQRVLMVGHLLQYHPAVVKLKELVSAGELGTLEYVYSNRLNLGKIRTEENILWSFAPHDISVMLGLVGAMPIQVNAVGGSYLQPNVADTTVSTFVFDNGVRAHIYVSWLHPFKEQRLVVVGSKKMAVFDDRAPRGKKLLLFDKRVSMVDGRYVAEKSEGVSVPFDEDSEPLRLECEHFLECIRTRAKPRTDGEEGLRVLKVLQSCQRSIQMNGQPVQVLDYRD